VYACRNTEARLHNHRCSGKTIGRVQFKRDGTPSRTGGEVKGKLANGVGSQYTSQYLGTWCIQHYYRWWRTARLPVVEWTDASADLNGLVRFAERRNLVSVHAPSHCKRSLLNYYECVSVVLVTQHVERMRSIILSSGVCSAVQHFPHII